MTSPHFVRIDTPAKINLRLRICGRAADGYHLLQTLISPISLSDTVVIERRPPDFRTSSARCVEIPVSVQFVGELGRQLASLPGGSSSASELRATLERQDNLAVRAIRRFRDSFLGETERSSILSLHLIKRIPVGAGLGGGSADAAGALRAMAALYPGRASKSELIALAAGIGSDVPALVACRLVAATGAGESVFQVRDGKGRPLSGVSGVASVIVKPPSGVNTAEAYGWLGLAPTAGVARTADVAERLRDSFAEELKPFGLFLDSAPFESPEAENGLTARTYATGDGKFTHNCYNDFHSVVLGRRADLRRLAILIESAGCSPVMLTGSGSALVGFCAVEEVAERVAALRTMVAPEVFISSVLLSYQGEIANS